MINQSQQFFSSLSSERKLSFYILCVLVFISSIFEILSLGIFVEFINIITNGINYLKFSSINRIMNYFFGEGIISINEKQIILLFIVINIISCLLRVYLLFYQTKISHYIGSDFSNGIFRNALYQPYSVHVSRSSSNILSGITVKSESIIYNFVLPILTILSSIPLLFSILVTLFFINSIATALSIAIFTFAYLSISFFTKNILDASGKKINDESNNLIKITQEGLGGVRDIIIDGTQNIYCEIFKKSDIQFRKSAIKIEIIGVSPRYVIEVFGMILIAVFALSMTGVDGGDSLITLAALAFGAQRMLPLFQQIYQSLSRLRGGRERVREALELYGGGGLASLDLERRDAKKSEGFIFNNKIEIRGISFSYNLRSKPLFEDLNLVIPKGSRVGFVGATGGGKSTLLDIIMGLLTPTSGSIFIDATQLNNKNIALWRSKITHVPQTIFLKDATVLENIAFGLTLEEIDFPRAIRAARQAMIADEIESWPLGYKTKVGERGIRLSGGQRQRIGIARALYKNASVVVLDEATSALDEATERKVMSSLYGLSDDITFLIVAHRVTTLAGCNVIVNLLDGKLVVKNCEMDVS